MSEKIEDTVTVWMPEPDREKGYFRGVYITYWQPPGAPEPVRCEFKAGLRYVVPRVFADEVLSKVTQSNNLEADEPETGWSPFRKAFLIRENGQAMDEAVAVKKRKLEGTPTNPTPLAGAARVKLPDEPEALVKRQVAAPEAPPIPMAGAAKIPKAEAAPEPEADTEAKADEPEADPPPAGKPKKGFAY